MNLLGIWTYLQSRFNRDEKGASLVEYVLLVALIAVVCIVALNLLGSSASTKLQSVGNSISSAGS
jgi:pilus assembly protein Flp/PilA